MSATGIPITDEMHEALTKQPGKPVEVVDPRTNHVYWLCDPGATDELFAARLKREIQAEVDEMLRGEVSPWDPAEIRAEAARRREDST